MPEAEKDPIRDIRIDRLGFVDEVVKQFKGPLNDKVKGDYESGDRLQGDFFDAILVQGEKTEVDFEGFVKLWEQKKITREQFVRGGSVSVAEAKKILAEKDLERISTTSPSALTLRVTRRKGIQVELVDAVKQLSDEISPAKLGTAA